ncbi:hypothetical protein [Streptomyces sp. NPDC018610]|jgi:hypothetical protein|uniref:hypothetical protein n=1 Tax=Streptomyces sp. NPDC018610 TaxID=3365049 RepID=UPI0037B65C41
MPAAENPSRPYPATGVSLRDLLASCAAAAAVSRPPRAPEPAEAGPDRSGARTDPRSAARTNAQPGTRTDPRPGSRTDPRAVTREDDRPVPRTVGTHREAA